jgi:hypothetical protein
MSLAFNAAPFSENYNNMDDNKNIIEKKRNRTIKKPIRHETPSHVSAMMNRIHNKKDDDDDLNDFYPENNNVLPLAYKNNNNGNNGNNGNNDKNSNNEAINRNVKDEQVSIEAFSKLPRDSTASDYYQQFIPNHYNQISENTGGNRELLEKLNYMIYLLEEQQNEKTGHVTEEVILYSFLGVFIIFVLDSFARAGKYIR